MRIIATRDFQSTILGSVSAGDDLTARGISPALAKHFVEEAGVARIDAPTMQELCDQVRDTLAAKSAAGDANAADATEQSSGDGEAPGGPDSAAGAEDPPQDPPAAAAADQAPAVRAKPGRKPKAEPKA